MTFGLALGLIAALLSFTSFMMKSMLPLRSIALASNVFFIAYGYLEWLLPAMVLHCLLLPVNAKRVLEIRQLIRNIEHATKDSPLAEWLLPHMKRRKAKAGDVLFRKGDVAEEMLYVQSGTVKLVEYGEMLGAGTLIGEIGLFSPERRRTQTVVCETDCELYGLTSEGMQRLYFQNPKLGFHLMRLIVSRLMRDLEVKRGDALPPAAAAA